MISINFRWEIKAQQNSTSQFACRSMPDKMDEINKYTEKKGNGTKNGEERIPSV